MSRGVAHALDYDFRLVPPAVMAPLQRRLEGGLRQTLSRLLGSAVSELAWERAKLTTCFGGLGIGVAQMVYGTGQHIGRLSTFTWPSCRTSALRLGDRSMTRILRRQQLWPQCRSASNRGVAVYEYARVMIALQIERCKTVGSGQAG